MKDLIPVPSKGTPLRASWGAAVANGMNAFASMSSPGMMSRDGLTGTGAQPIPTNRRDRKSASDIHPWKFYGMVQSEDVDHCFEIVVPDGCVMVGDSEAVIEGLTATGNGSERYVLDCESDISSGTLLYLVIYKDEEDDESTWKALVCTDSSVSEYEDVSVAVLMIAKLTIDETTDGNQFGKVDAQYAHSSICIRGSDEDDETAPSPFMIRVTVTEDEQTGDPVVTHSVENRSFYWDGELKTISSPHVISSSDTAVWLVATQNSPSSSGEQPWTFSLSNSQGQAPSDGRVVNYKLYDLDAFEVTCDYRTTFLELNSPHKVAKFEVSPPSGNAQQKIVLDAVTSSPEISVTDGTNEIELKPSDLSNGNKVSVHTLTVHHADGTSDEYDVLSDSDIEITEASGTVLADVSIGYSTETHNLTYTKTMVNLETGATSTVGPTTIFTAVTHSENT